MSRFLWELHQSSLFFPWRLSVLFFETFNERFQKDLRPDTQYFLPASTHQEHDSAHATWTFSYLMHGTYCPRTTGARPLTQSICCRRHESVSSDQPVFESPFLTARTRSAQWENTSFTKSVFEILQETVTVSPKNCASRSKLFVVFPFQNIQISVFVKNSVILPPFSPLEKSTFFHFPSLHCLFD